MPSLYLIIHGALHEEPGTPPEEWGLTVEGRRAAMALDDVLPPFGQVVLSSVQTAAVETARAIAAARRHATEVLVDERLIEVHRPPGANDAESLRRYLDGEELDGWEPVWSAALRVRSAIRAAQSEDLGARLLVTHPLTLACWVASQLECTPAVAAARLTLPDVWRFDPVSNRVEHVGVRPR